MSERWDIETITARAARDWADQFHFGRGAGDDSEAYEADYARAKRGIADALAERDRQVAERAWDEGYLSEGWHGPDQNPHRAAKGEHVTIPAHLAKPNELGPAIRKLLVDEARAENRDRQSENVREVRDALARNRAAKEEQK